MTGLRGRLVGVSVGRREVEKGVMGGSVRSSSSVLVGVGGGGAARVPNPCAGGAGERECCCGGVVGSKFHSLVVDVARGVLGRLVSLTWLAAFSMIAGGTIRTMGVS